MKALKYILATFILLGAAGQLLPVYNITMGLIEGGGNKYSFWKLFAHAFFIVVMIVLSIKLFNSARNIP